MHRGYVKFYRRALDNGWLKDHPVWVLMSYCLLRANHAEAPDVCRGSKVSLKPGQFIFGRDSASRETALSPQQVRTALAKLQAYQFLTIRATKRFSVITICNWGIYQAEEKVKQPTEQPTGNQQVTNRQPTDNHKQECKNVNIKNKSCMQPSLFDDLQPPEEPPTTTTKRFKAPTIEEIAEYCKERGNGIDAQHFHDYYQARGWMVGKSKMKDWKAAIRTWERNDTQQQNAPAINTDYIPRGM